MAVIKLLRLSSKAMRSCYKKRAAFNSFVAVARIKINMFFKQKRAKFEMDRDDLKKIITPKANPFQIDLIVTRLP